MCPTDQESADSRIAVALPALLLVSVACCQIALTRTAQLSPWKGGGFGMFASLDGLGFRRVRLFVEALDRNQEIELPGSLAEAAMKSAVLPTSQSLVSLGRGILAHERQHARPVSRVRVEIWRTHFTTSLESHKVRIATVTVDADASEARPTR